MSEQSESNQSLGPNTLKTRAAVILVKYFGSWASVIIHTIIFASWFVLKLNLQLLLVIVSIEAIYNGLFILMAENSEAAQKEHKQKMEHKKDMSVVKKDAAIDRKSLEEIAKLHQRIESLEKLIKKQHRK